MEIKIESETQELVAEPIDLSPLEKRIDEVVNQLNRLEASANAPAASPVKAPKPFDWFVAKAQAEVLGEHDRLTRFNEDFKTYLETREGGLEDVVGTLDGENDASGLVAEAYIASQLVNVLENRRPMFRNLGSFPMPRSGYARIPVVTQNTEVDDRSGQKEPANSRALRVVTQAFEAEWFDGAVDIALELIQTGELAVLQMVWNDLLGQYGIATEDGVIARIEAAQGFNYVGAPLSTASYAAFAEQVATQALVIRDGSGAPATKLAVPYALWPKVIAMVDANDRRQFTSGDHSDGNVTLTAEQFALPGGIDVFAARVEAAILFNGQSLMAADGGPTRVEATNVELMGRDLGLLGRIMFVPRIPAGVVVFAEEESS